MNATEVRAEIHRALPECVTVDDIVSMARSLRDRGAKQEDVYAVMLEWLSDKQPMEQNDELDVLRDALDFVSGWCHPRNKIW